MVTLLWQYDNLGVCHWYVCVWIWTCLEGGGINLQIIWQQKIWDYLKNGFSIWNAVYTN